MPFYYTLKNRIRKPAERDRVIDKLLSLRGRLDRHLPPKDADDNLLLATWNIRDLGKKNRRGYGPRLPETHFYIAEIISRFDLVAVQEVNRLEEWEKIMAILGPDWDYIATDVTDPALGGNGERMTFVYDRRKVRFRNIAGEIVLPASMLISKVKADGDGDKLAGGKQFRRTPFVAAFQAGWFRFDICTVHIYYGAESGKKLKERIQEIDAITAYLSDRADIGLDEERGLILLGDFNIVSPDHKTMQALLKHKFRVPQALRRKTNVAGTKYYDQIAFKTRRDILEFIDNGDNAGVFPLFRSCFRANQLDDYREAMGRTSALQGARYGGDLSRYYRDWRTYQMSDHNPLWVRLKVNRSDAYLRRLRQT